MSDYKIISWNVCFGCMLSNDKSVHDRTAIVIATKCKDDSHVANGRNVCLNNVVNVLKSGNYDIICLQEATNWKNIFHELNTHTDYYYASNSVNINDDTFSEIVTFYNKNKFKLLYAKNGDVHESRQLSRHHDARPYQILFFNEIASGKQIVTINIHNGHGITKDVLERTISRDIQICLNLDTIANVRRMTLPNRQMKSLFSTLTGERNNDNLSTIDITNYIDNNDLNVIMMGDFNDNGGRYNYWRGLNLMFGHKTIVVSSDNMIPPKTCCQGHSRLRTNITQEPMIGDYILVNNNFEYIKHNEIPQYNYNANIFPTSDHLAITATIRIKNLQNILPNVTQNVLLCIKPTIYFLLGMNLHGKPINLLSKFIYPNGNVCNTMVYVQDTTNTHIIGYIRRSYLTQNSDGTWSVNTRGKTLRYLCDLADPNKFQQLNGFQHRGETITSANKLRFPNGEDINGLVIVQDVDDPNSIGFVDKKFVSNCDDLDVHGLKGGSRHFHKYMKYKTKYIEQKL